MYRERGTPSGASVCGALPERWTFGGEPAKVEALGEVTARFIFPTPAPKIVKRFAVDCGQTFQPKHFLGRFMDAHNPEATALRAADGFAFEAEAIDWFYGGSD